MPATAECNCSCHKAKKLPGYLRYLSGGYNPYANKRYKEKCSGNEKAPLSTAPGVAAPKSDTLHKPAPIDTSSFAPEPVEPATVTAEPNMASTEAPEPTITEQVSINKTTLKVTKTEPEWTTEEDSKLLELKGQNKSWKQISTEIGDKDGIKDRYKQLMKVKHAAENKGEEVVASAEDPNSKATQTKVYETASEGLMVDDPIKRNPSKATTSKAISPPATPLSKYSAGSWIDRDNKVIFGPPPVQTYATAPQPPAVKNAKESVTGDVSSLAKNYKAAAEAYSKAKYPPNKSWPCPHIMLDDGDELSEEMMTTLFNLKIKCDQRYWVELSSRFWDKTGLRIDPIELREKLEGQW